MTAHGFIRHQLAVLWADGKGKSLASIAAAWGLLVGVRMVYPVIIPHLQSSYGFSLTISGLLVSSLWFFGSIGQLPGGVLADKYNERTLLVVSIATVSVALSVVALSTSLSVLFFATAMWGLGHSLYPIARITLLSDLYSDRLGSALGVTMAIGDSGQTILPPIASFLAATIAWQVGLGVAVPFLLVIGVILFIVLPVQRTSNEGTSEGPLPQMKSVLKQLKNPDLGSMTLILFLYLFVWQSFTAFFPTYLIVVKNIPTSIASLLFGFFFAVGIVAKPLGGAAYDTFGMRWSLIGVLCPAFFGFILLTVVDGLLSLFVVTALISIMLGSGAITQSYLADSFSAKMQGTGLGVIRTLTATLGAGGPVVFGVVADNGYFTEGYLVLAGVMGFIIVLTFKIN